MLDKITLSNWDFYLLSCQFSGFSFLVREFQGFFMLFVSFGVWLPSVLFIVVCLSFHANMGYSIPAVICFHLQILIIYKCIYADLLTKDYIFDQKFTLSMLSSTGMVFLPHISYWPFSWSCLADLPFIFWPGLNCSTWNLKIFSFAKMLYNIDVMDENI